MGGSRLARAFLRALVACGGFGPFRGFFRRPRICLLGDAHRYEVFDRLRHRGILKADLEDNLVADLHVE